MNQSLKMKKHLFLLLPLLVCSFASQAQNTAGKSINAVTEYGDSVVLLATGQWQLMADYRANLLLNNSPKDTSAIAYSIPAGAKGVVPKIEEQYTVWYNKETWESINPQLLNREADIVFNLKGETEGYGMIIHDLVAIDLEQMQEIALNRVDKAADSKEVQKVEYREVNGQIVLYMELKAKVNGLDLQYYYYIGNPPGGTIQYIVFAAAPITAAIKQDLFGLLNGLVIGTEKED